MPETKYARSGDVNIAYQVIGDGPGDLVYVPGWISNIDVMWEDPGMARFLRRLASFSRLIIFDKRGTGLSDSVPVDKLPDLETRMDDLRAVMEAAGSEHATLLGHSEGGALCMLFAATYPARTDRIILIGAFARGIRSDNYPWPPSAEEFQDLIDAVGMEWGTGDFIAAMAPSRSSDKAFCEWMRRYQRLSASPRAAAALLQMNASLDVRSVLGSITSPTLVLHRVGDREVLIEEGRYLAEAIPNARMEELDGADHLFWAGDSEVALQEIEEFLTGRRGVAEADRRLATVLFTDIVDSTDTAGRLGDRTWRDVLERHNQIIRSELRRWGGSESNTTGDGFLATFDLPARAIRCALGIADAVRALDIVVRCGLHAGEIEVIGDDIGGVAVHIAARVEGLARAGEVLVSRTVKDLVAGQEFAFEDRGAHALKGVADPWRVFAVTPAAPG